MRTSSDQLFRHVERLASLQPSRNYLNLASLNEARDNIASELASYGYTPEMQSWQAGGNTYYNVIARYNAGRERTLVVGAHYDVAGDQPGADDNASAVAGLLETARLLQSVRPELDYTVELVAYSLEEPPFFATEQMGSFVHARSLHEQQATVLGMVCYEMIGYFTDEPGTQQFPSEAMKDQYGTRGDFIAVVSRPGSDDFARKVYLLMKEAGTVRTELAILPGDDGLSGLSDQRNYWHFGYQALMINDTSFLRNPNYHMPTDTPDTLDYERMAGVVEASFRAISNL